MVIINQAGQNSFDAAEFTTSVQAPASLPEVENSSPSADYDIQQALRHADQLISEFQQSHSLATDGLSPEDNRLKLVVSELWHTQQALEKYYLMATEIKCKLLDKGQQLSVALARQRELELLLNQQAQELDRTQSACQQLEIDLQAANLIVENQARVHDVFLKLQTRYLRLLSRLLAAFTRPNSPVTVKPHLRHTIFTLFRHSC